MTTTNRKVVAAVLAGAALALALTNAVAGIAVLIAGLAVVLGISTIALSVAAFVLSLRLRSYIVAGLLVATGVMGMIPGWIALGNFTVIAFPGPILGVIFGLAILGLGIATGIGTVKRTLLSAAE